MLPTITLGNYRISRLIIGHNPFKGNSHFSEAMDRDMREYFTQKRMIETLFECERQGLTAMLSRGDREIMAMVDEYRRRGGRLHWICQTATEWGDIPDNIRTIARHGPIAIYHHGTHTDSLYQEGRLGVMREYLKVIRDLGLLVGVGTHIPEVIEYTEEHNWNVDFYMASLYNLSKIERTSMLVSGERTEEPYDDEDREIMCQVIQKTAKTCLAFKTLAASRKATSPAAVREAFEFAFRHIKPTDAVVVGMFPKYKNQIEENVGIVREVVG
jgi:hypothetical protein